MIHQFLNAFAIAIITGRALILLSSEKQACGQLLHSLEWMVYMQAGPTMFRILSAVSVVRQAETGDCCRPPMAQLACNGMDADQRIIMSLGMPGQRGRLNLKTFNFDEAAVLQSSVAIVSNKARRRASILFSLGTDTAFGALFAASFQFNQTNVVLPTWNTLCASNAIECPSGEKPANSFWLAVHVRCKLISGKLPDIGEVLLPALVEPIQVLLNGGLLNATSRCALLLASDNSKVKPWLQGQLRKWGFGRCPIVTSDQEALLSKQGRMTAHGSLADVTSLRDVHLLSRADAFIGTFQSSLSIAISEAIVGRHAPARPAIIHCRLGSMSQKKKVIHGSCDPANTTQVTWNDSSLCAGPWPRAPFGDGVETPALPGCLKKFAATHSPQRRGRVERSKGRG